jgi:16S rRNA processing protein RimM
MEPAHLVVGFVNRPHGVKGELFIRSLTDHPEDVFVPGVVLRSGGRDSEAPDPDAPPLRVESVRPFQGGFLVHFGGVRDRNDADGFRGLYLYAARDLLPPLDEGEVFHFQLRGMRVETRSGEEVGRIQEVYELMPHDLLEVRTTRGSVLIPFQDDVVVEIHREEGRVVIDAPEGLLDLGGG